MAVFGIIAIVIIIILVVVLLRYVFADPYTLQNIQNAQTASTISASSLAGNSTGNSPTNFAFSVWVYVNDWNYRYGENKVVFGRMTGKSSSNVMANIKGEAPCPLLVLGATENNATIAIECYNGVVEPLPQMATLSAAEQTQLAGETRQQQNTIIGMMHRADISRLQRQQNKERVIYKPSKNN
jgi:hypothetical protein